MKRILLFLIGVLIVIVEGSITNYVDILGVSVNFLLIYITIISLYLDDIEAVTIAVLLGFVKDIALGSIFGVNALILAVVAYGISNLNDKIYKNSYITVFALVFITSLIDSIVNIVLLGTVYQTYDILHIFIKGICTVPLVNSIGSLIFYYIFKGSILKLKKD
ncbi:MAG: rod shape-determining protein MreD [Paraclostridium bifermentans]|jgi:rod shape-determining protein MreD|uniref:Rod shape-determining protein MreD n=1 Tax=Paraclostridium bifermentans TaxID=1490 RepID=A0AA44DLD2_PARBF|nr:MULTISPECIES: rod shape-determining protein MreD [Paraclostridium]KGJ50919.1 rod shape-determining protein MreD [Clostridium sp. NCR]RDC51149.1 rod shape-determining protein MreD [Acinetobacter sp. RIT592]MBN8046249.1 rod shape-determining protein MreD [Paraclostridium bifermentans]MBS5953307.1 rod shape-determining protein MreD [Paraclostridium bifermentans]MBS6506604.1 rod shape-determining protein MreD [Paraclostridium bifermentans]